MESSIFRFILIDQVMDCVRNLFVHSLLPSAMLQAHDFVRETVQIPRLPIAVNLNKVKDKREQTGIFSTLSQFLTGGFDEDNDQEHPTKKQVENQSVAFACIHSCKIEDLFSESRYWVI
jgi:hypothetical protein